VRGCRRGCRLMAVALASLSALSLAAPQALPQAALRSRADTSEFVAWARAAARPLAGPVPSATHADLAPLAQAIGSARVVALGEPAHGAQEPLAFRNRLFKYLVRHDGVTAIALESSFTESRAIDDFVLGGAGDAATLARRDLSWGFGRYEENVRLIRWMRNYNQRVQGRRRLHFYGIDMSGGGDKGDYANPGVAVRSAVVYLRTAAPQSSAAVLKGVEPQMLLLGRVGYWQMALHHPRSLQGMLGSLSRYVDSNGPMLRRASSSADYDWAAHNLVVARQLFDYLRLQTAPEGNSMTIGPYDYREDNVREAAMASNVLWALGEEGPGGRLMVYAHDGHVMNGRSRGGIWSVYKHPPLMMGGRLRRQLGTRLVIIGTLAAHSGRGLPEGRPIAGTVGEILGRLHMPRFFLDLRQARGHDGAARWLEKRRPICVNFDTEMDVVPARAFDVLVFMDGTTPAIPNRTPN
jgi:erythromycin esterase